VSVIINEAAICAILAQECDKFLHRDSYNGPAQEMRNQQIHGYLKAIEEEIFAARQMLLGQFGRIVVNIIDEALDYIDSTGIGRREVSYINEVNTILPDNQTRERREAGSFRSFLTPPKSLFF
jgi:hypothetical protein